MHWVILQRGEVVGRVHSASLCAGTMLPDAPVCLESYAVAGKKKIKRAKAGILVRPELCTRLWSNPRKKS